MPEEYLKEELQKIYEALPEDLKEALFSEKTADEIYDVCVENGLEEKSLELAKYVGYVLLGLLSPNEFEKTVEEKLALRADPAKKVSREIVRLVFLPVKTGLEALYKIKIELPAEPSEKLAEEKLPEEQTSKKRADKDVYREPIE